MFVCFEFKSYVLNLIYSKQPILLDDVLIRKHIYVIS